MITQEQLRELRFMANCHNKAPLWSEFNRKAIADVLADVDALTGEVARLMEAGRDMQEQRDGWQEEAEKARGERNYWRSQTDDANSRRDFVAAERDALAAELATVRAQLEPVEPMLYRSAPPRRHEWDEQ